MKLDEALQMAKDGGYSIRTPEMGHQMLRQDGEDPGGNIIFKLTATLNPPVVFSDFDKSRTDWEVVGVTPSAVLTSLPLESEFSESQAKLLSEGTIYTEEVQNSETAITPKKKKSSATVSPAETTGNA